ncbi:MAG: hypothetical protein CSA65_03210 [Proteobacteria bacterium]|nr:MAG: hypothetical protein CSA65_03210 [Pseudomonadota bacterium]
MSTMMTSARRTWLALPALLGLLLAAGACDKQKLIPNTKIADTKGNRELLGVIAEYRDAMVRKDAARILTLVHPSYQDNAGTPEPEDDIDFDRLKHLLVSRFKRAKRVHYRIEFQRVMVKGREAVVDAWIDATFVYQHPNYRPHYKRIADYNRYQLLHIDGKWRFIRGL